MALGIVHPRLLNQSRHDHRKPQHRRDALRANAEHGEDRGLLIDRQRAEYHRQRGNLHGEHPPCAGSVGDQFHFSRSMSPCRK